MDIPALSIASSQSKVQAQAGLMVMKKAMDHSEQTSQAMIELAASTPVSPPHLGQAIDISA